MKYCTKCKTEKPLTEFRKDGKGHSWCRNCQNEYNREWYHKNRERGLRWRKNLTYALLDPTNSDMDI